MKQLDLSREEVHCSGYKVCHPAVLCRTEKLPAARIRGTEPILGESFSENSSQPKRAASHLVQLLTPGQLTSNELMCGSNSEASLLRATHILKGSCRDSPPEWLVSLLYLHLSLTLLHNLTFFTLPHCVLGTPE